MYFHVHTAATLSPPTDKNWMVLLIDTDADPNTGWHGYDLLVNRRRAGNRCTVERCIGGAWRWKTVATVPAHWSGSSLTLALPRALLGPPRAPLVFDFKWTDNLPDTPAIMDFYSKGDVAPDARFNYHYQEVTRIMAAP